MYRGASTFGQPFPSLDRTCNAGLPMIQLKRRPATFPGIPGETRLTQPRIRSCGLVLKA